MIDFIRESNRIEGINREPTAEELTEFERFMGLDKVGVGDLDFFVSVYQPNARLRDASSMPGARVGDLIAPASGPQITESLQGILLDMKENGPWQTHVLYETLHPFTDGNGRSGRMLWAWQMGIEQLGLGFLHMFYYQTLGNSR